MIKLENGSYIVNTRDFFTDITQYFPAYTDTPSMYIEVERLVNGLPPFKLMTKTITKSREKKILLIPEKISEQSDWKLIDEDLAILGFKFYYCNHDGVYEQTGVFTDETKLSERPPSVIELAKTLNIEVERILLVPSIFTLEDKMKAHNLLCNLSEMQISDNELTAFLIRKGKEITHLIVDIKENSATKFTKENTASLGNLHFLSIQNCGKNDYPYFPTKKINSLTLNLCTINPVLAKQINSMPLQELCVYDSKGLDYSQMNNIQDLKFILISGKNSNTPIPLFFLLDNAPKLKMLSLEFSTIDWSRKAGPYQNFSELSSIEFVEVNVSLNGMNIILRETVNLKKLSMNTITIDNNNELLVPHKLNALEHLEIICCDMSVTNIQTLIAAAPGIRILTITGDSNGYDLDELIPEEFCLNKLRELNLVGNKINAATLQRILSQTNNSILKIVNLDYSHNLILDDLDLTNFPTTEIQYECTTNANLDALDDNDGYEDAWEYLDADTKTKVEYPPIKRIFIGYPNTPHPSAIRRNFFSRIELNQQMQDINNPFILQRTESRQNTTANSTVTRNTTPLKPIFDLLIKNKPDHNVYLGIIDLVVSNKWCLLPSISAQEKLEQIYSARTIELEFTKSTNGFYFCRSPEQKYPQKIHLEIILSEPPITATEHIHSLPDKVKQLINYCSSFTQGTLYLPNNVVNNAEHYMKALFKQKIGSCRHRSAVFAYIMQNMYPNIPVQLISNECHMYPEIFHQGLGIWVKYDLGGYPAAITINELTFNEKEYPQPNIDTSKTLKLEFTLEIPAHINCDQIYRLELLDCSFKNDALRTLLQKTPYVNTLYISPMPEALMAELDLSTIPSLKRIELEDNHLTKRSFLSFVRKQKKHRDFIWVGKGPLMPTEKIPPILELHRTEMKKVRPHYCPPPQTIAPDELIKRRPNTLLKSTHPLDVAYNIQKKAIEHKRRFFFIDNPNQLKCQKPFIKGEGPIGTLHKGPSGPLFDFIKENPEGLIITDYSTFSGDDIAQHNSSIDSRRMFDGIHAPGIQVIGCINPESYKGADLYSRFKEKFTVDAPKLRAIKTECIPENNGPVIELAGQNNALGYLNGYWTPNGQQFIFQKGILADILHDNPEHININNPPLADPEFIRFVRDWDLHHPQGPKLNLCKKELSWESQKLPCTWSDATALPEEFQVLNSVTLNALLGEYEVIDNALYKKPGLLQQTGCEKIALYSTDSLSSGEWLSLLNAATKYNKELVLYSAPEVSYPTGFPVEYNKFTYTLNPSHNTLYFINHPATLPWNTIKIDITELSSSDLFPGIKNVLDQDTRLFSFAKKEGFLTNALNQGETVILSGKWSIELRQSITALMAERIRNPQCPGTLVVISSEEDVFPWIRATRIYPASSYSINQEILVPFAERYETVERALTHASFIFLSGETGTGKTHFIQHQWHKKHPCFYGEDALEAWVRTQPQSADQYVTLFIDEANITQRQWSEFTYMHDEAPSIFYKGQHYILSTRHRVIFAGNPESYGGERTRPQLFDQPHPILKFAPIPLQHALNRLRLPHNWSTAINDFLQKLENASPHHLIITPREALMIGMLAQTLTRHYADYTPQELTAYIGYRLFATHLPAKERQQFIPPYTLLPGITQLPKPGDFVLTETIQPAVEAIHWHLALREARQQGVVPQGGLGGLVLEGEPGIGKSELITQMLNAYGFQADIDYVYIAASLDFEEKQAALLAAFHQGLIVIIDEINSAPRLERVLNGLLEGHDLDNKHAQKPGFLLLGTQNPIYYQGRTSTTLPLKHRLHHLELNPYTTEESIDILRKRDGVPLAVAQEMVYEYEVRKKTNTELCFRDLIEWSQLWKKNMSPQKAAPDYAGFFSSKSAQLHRLTEEEEENDQLLKKSRQTALPYT